MRKTLLILIGLHVLMAGLSWGEEVRVAAWYGSSTYVCSDWLLAAVPILNGATTTRGGQSFGVDFWVGDELQCGIGTAYVPEFAADFTTSFTFLFVTLHYNAQAALTDVPMFFQVRYFPVPRWFIGAGAGVLGFSSVLTVSKNLWFIPLTGASISGQNYQFGFEVMTGITLIEDQFGRMDFTVRGYTPWPFVKDFRMDLIPTLTLSLGF
jgi:hypothetical protein